MNEVLYKTLASVKNRAHVPPGRCLGIDGLRTWTKVICIDQSPSAGRRSNPATYPGVFNDAAALFNTGTQAQGLRPGAVLLQHEGWALQACSGDSLIKIEMHFLPDYTSPASLQGAAV